MQAIVGEMSRFGEEVRAHLLRLPPPARPSCLPCHPCAPHSLGNHSGFPPHFDDQAIRRGAYPGFPAFSRSSLVPWFVLDKVLGPLNEVADVEGCKHTGPQTVTTPTGFKAAYNQFNEGGWLGLSYPEKWGGQGLPQS